MQGYVGSARGWRFYLGVFDHCALKSAIACSKRVAAMLKLRYRFNDDDIAEITALALHGLVQSHTDAA